MKISPLNNQSFKALYIEDIDSLADFGQDGIEASKALRKAMPELKRLANDCDIYVSSGTHYEGSPQVDSLNILIFNKDRDSFDRVHKMDDKFEEVNIYKPFNAEEIIESVEQGKAKLDVEEFDKNKYLDDAIKSVKKKPAGELKRALLSELELLKQAFNTTYRETTR